MKRATDRSFERRRKKISKREVEALVEAVRKDSRSGMLLVAERLGAALSDQLDLVQLGEVMTGHVPVDDYGRGIRTALLELRAAASAARLNLKRYHV